MSLRTCFPCFSTTSRSRYRCGQCQNHPPPVRDGKSGVSVGRGLLRICEAWPMSLFMHWKMSQRLRWPPASGGAWLAGWLVRRCGSGAGLCQLRRSWSQQCGVITDLWHVGLSKSPETVLFDHDTFVTTYKKHANDYHLNKRHYRRVTRMAGETGGTGRDLPLRAPLIPFPEWDPGEPNI